MLNTYIDESYGENDYYTAALTLDDVGKYNLENNLLEVKEDISKRHGLPSDIEFHAHDIMQGRCDWKFLRGNVREALWIYKTALKVIADSEPLVVVEGIDVARLKRRYSYPHPPYDITLRHVLEKVNDFAVKRQDKVNVIADNRSDYKQYQTNIEHYSLYGTPGYRSCKYPRINQPIQYKDSCDDILLQAVDLVAYIARRKHEKLGCSTAQKAARNLYNVIGEFSTVRKWLP